METESHALNELEAEARALTRCPVCLETFHVPKVLPCQHTFCRRCLEGCFAAANAQRLTSVSNFPCPTCRKTCYVPLGGLDLLPTDIKMKQITELWEKVESSGLQAGNNRMEPAVDEGNFILCGVCIYQKDRQPADKFCLQCTKALCSKCFSQHSRTGLFREHSVVSVACQDEQSNDVDDQCKEHMNEMEHYYCRDCQRSLCSVCVLQPSHETHTICKRSSASHERGAYDLSDLLKNLEQRSGNLARAIRSIDLLKKEIIRMTTESEKAIENSFRQAKQKLKDVKSKLIEESRLAKETSLGLVNSAEKKFLEEQNSSKKLNDSLRKKLGSKDLTPKDDELMKKLTEELRKPQPTLDTSCSIYVIYVPAISVSLGQLRVHHLEGIDQALFPGENNFSESSPVLTDNAVEKKFRHRDKPYFVKDCATAGLKRNAKESYDNHLATAAEEATGRENESQKDAILQTLVRTLSIRASAAATTRSSSAVASKYAAEDSAVSRDEDFVNCRDCCFLDNDQLLVTGQSRSSEGLVKIVNTRTLEVVRSFDRCVQMRPWGLANCQDSLNPSSFLVTDHETNMVNLVKPDGIMSLGTPKLKKPTGIALTRAGQYVITDTASANPCTNRIGLYAVRAGKLHLVRKLAGFGPGDGEVLGASYVAVDSSDRVLVSDSESRNIKVFNLRGEQLLKFSSCGPDGQEMLPQGLAIDGAMNIFVVDQSTGSVALYSPDGHLVHGSILQNLPTAWGISFNEQQKLIAVATDLGPKVFRL